MDKQPDIQKSEPRPPSIGLGERLQAARIQQGLSVEDIASRMHLNAQIVKSIEDNNFDDITAPIFVKGYLRAYARILSLDEEEIIQEYANYYSHEDPPITTTSNMAPELSVADVRIKWTTYLVILGLVALLAAWWWNKNQDEATPISLDSQGAGDTNVQLNAGGGEVAPGEQPAAVGESRSEAPLAIQGDPQPQAAPSQPAVDEADAAAVEIDQPQSSEPPEPVELPEPPEPPEPAAAAQPVEPQDAPLAPAATAVGAEDADDAAAEIPVTAAASEGDDVPAAPEAAAEPEPVPIRLGAPVLIAPSGSDILSLTVNADTWADISDGNDFQMVYHLLRAGQSLELTGSAPFSVFLGNGPGVEIRFNGEPIEFSARIRNDNTARLSIGS